MKVEAGLENGFSQSAADTKSEPSNLVAVPGSQSEEVIAATSDSMHEVLAL